MSVPHRIKDFPKNKRNLCKHKALKIEPDEVWRIMPTAILAAVFAHGVVKKKMGKYTNQIPGNIMIHEVQKILLPDTVHILRRDSTHKINSLYPNANFMYKGWTRLNE